MQHVLRSLGVDVAGGPGGEGKRGGEELDALLLVGDVGRCRGEVADNGREIRVR